MQTMPTSGYVSTAAAPMAYAGATTVGTTTLAAATTGAISYGRLPLQQPVKAYTAPTSMSVLAPRTAAPVTTTKVTAAPVFTTKASAAPASVVMAAPAVTMKAPVTQTTVQPTVQRLVAAAPQLVSTPQVQYLPTVSSVVVTQAQATKSPAGAMRVTIVPTKEGAKEPLMKFLNGSEASDGMSKCAGLNFAQALIMDDKLIVGASYDSLANLEAATPTATALFGAVSDQFAGAPVRYTGELTWFWKGPGKIDGPVASRVTLLPIKTGSEAGIMEKIPQIEPMLKDNKAFEECIDIRNFFFENKLVILSRYSSTKGLEESDKQMSSIMAPLAPFIAGAPEKYAGTTAWTYPTVKAAKKKGKRGCC